MSRETPALDNSSINAHIDVTLDVFDTFAGRAGSGCWFFKSDFDAAFRRVRVRLRDLHLGGFFVPGGYSLLLRLCFGGRSSVHIWELVVACFLALLRADAGIHDMAHWVDDLFRVCPSYAQAHATASSPARRASRPARLSRLTGWDTTPTFCSALSTDRLGHHAHALLGSGFCGV